MIVMEGADNSGKSTFGRSIALPYFSAGPAPKDARELRNCLSEQRARAPFACIQDRLTCISQQIYSDDPTSTLLQGELVALIDMEVVVVVYCRPPERTLMDLSTHRLKSYDTEENMEKIVLHQHEYIRKYDDLMSTIPHIIYDWTEHDDESNHQIRSMLVDSQNSTTAWKKLIETTKMGRISF